MARVYRARDTVIGRTVAVKILTEEGCADEETKLRFKDAADVVFLSIDTDEDHQLVKPFIDSVKWTQKIYFDTWCDISIFGRWASVW